LDLGHVNPVVHRSRLPGPADHRLSEHLPQKLQAPDPAIKAVASETITL